MNKFTISDLHLGHNNIIKFTDNTNGRPDQLIRTKADGSPFESVDEMHSYLIDRWNSVVTARDRVYILGDIAFPKHAWNILNGLNGQLVGVLGNHDTHQDEYHRLHKVYGAIDMGDVVFTHIPVHTSQVAHRWKGNVHGHLHQNVVKDPFGVADPRYLNVSVEQCDFTPISFEEVIETFKSRDIDVNRLKDRN